MRKPLFLLLFSLLTFFVKAQRNDHISTNVDKLTPEIIDAWKLVYDARPTDCYRRDFPLLQNITAFKKSTQLWNWIGGESGMKIILQKNINAPCPPCVSCEQPKYPYLNRMSEYIADVGHLYRYQDKPGINVVLNALKGLTRNGRTYYLSPIYMVVNLAINWLHLPVKKQERIKNNPSTFC